MSVRPSAMREAPARTGSATRPSGRSHPTITDPLLQTISAGTTTVTTPGSSPTARTCRHTLMPGLGDQLELAEDRNGIGVHVLPLHQPVLERDDVHPVPGELAAGGLGRDLAPLHPVRVRGGGRPLLHDEAVAHVAAPRRERD